MNYVLVGLDEGRQLKEIAVIDKHLKAEKIVFNLSTQSIYDVLMELNTMSLFAEQKLVIVKNCLFLGSGSLEEAQANALINYCLHPDPKHTLVLCAPIEKCDNRKKIVKSLQSACKVLLFPVMKEEDKRKYVVNRLKQLDVSVDAFLLNMIVERCPLDSALIDSQLDKLSLYPDKLDQDTIMALLVRPYDDNIFLLCESILKGNSKKAFRLYLDMVQLSYDPFYMIATITSQFHFYYQVCHLKQKAMNENEIASELGAHPYRTKLTLQNVMGVDQDKILRILNLLAICDQSIKNGKLDKKIAFEMFLIKSEEIMK